jgi:hypothetical protein
MNINQNVKHTPPVSHSFMARQIAPIPDLVLSVGRDMNS